MIPPPTTVAEVLRDPERRRALRCTHLLDSAPEPAFDRLTRMARDLLHCTVATVTLVDHDRQFFKSEAGLPDPWRSRRETPAADSMCQFVVGSGAPLAVEDARTVPEFRNLGVVDYLRTIAYLGVPLRAPDGQVIGAVCAIEPEPRHWTAADRAWLEDLAEIARSELLLRHEAGHDPLTGLANRRLFDAVLLERLGRAAAAGETCTLLAIDLDAFKPINDLHGHAAGDEVLRQVAGRLLEGTEPVDLVARVGGDEFAIILGRHRDPSALAAALRQSIGAPIEVEGERFRIDTSIGCATATPAVGAELEPDRLLAAADQELYRTKAAHGGGRAVTAAER